MPEVTDIISVEDENELLTYAFALENGSEHPLGKAVAEYCKAKGISLKPAENFKVYAGNGLEGIADGKLIKGGNLSFVTAVEPEYEAKAQALAEQGKTPLFFEADGKLIGIIAVAMRSARLLLKQ